MAKKTRRRRRVLVLLIVVIFGVIAGIGIYQNLGNQGSKVEAKDYFQVVEAGITSSTPAQNGTVQIVYIISVTFKAVKGDAHEVVVQSWGYGDPALIGEMKKDVPRTVTLYSPRGVYIALQPDGFPTSIRITSLEASGIVEFNLSP